MLKVASNKINEKRKVLFFAFIIIGMACIAVALFLKISTGWRLVGIGLVIAGLIYNYKMEPKCYTFKIPYLVLIMEGIIYLFVTLCFGLSDAWGWGGFFIIIFGFLLNYIDLHFCDTRQLKLIFDYDKELGIYKSFMHKNYDKREIKY